MNRSCNWKAELLEQARKRWEESEWVLRKLRCRTATDTRRPDDETLIEWHQRNTSALFNQ